MNLSKQKKYKTRIELFGTSKKLFKCTLHAKDMRTEEETFKQIAKFHKDETEHTNIYENYESLKILIYFKNLKLLIQKCINNLDIYNTSKYPKPKPDLTETSLDINQIVHADTYVNTKHNFFKFYRQIF